MNKTLTISILTAAAFMAMCAYVIRSNGEAYERLSSSPHRTGAAHPQPSYAAPPISGVSETAEALSGKQVAMTSSSFAVASREAAPESQIVTHAQSKSPFADRLYRVRERDGLLSGRSQTQWANLRTVEEVTRAHGYGSDIAQVSFAANGFHESGWNATTQNFADAKVNGYPSNGFFQLTRGPLVVRANAEFLVTREPYKSRTYEWYKQLKRENWDAGTAAYEFAKQVLRPAKRYRSERRQTAEKWWGLLEEER